MRTAILVTSDKGSRGERADQSGPALKAWLKDHAADPAWVEIVPDETERIVERLTAWADSDQFDLIVTAGGTGVSPRDVTPDATLKVVERVLPGFGEVMRARSLAKTPHAMISRAVGGIRKRTLIVNLPGSPRAAVENLEAVWPAIPHAIDKIRGDPPIALERRRLAFQDHLGNSAIGRVGKRQKAALDSHAVRKLSRPAAEDQHGPAAGFAFHGHVAAKRFPAPTRPDGLERGFFGGEPRCVPFGTVRLGIAVFNLGGGKNALGKTRAKALQGRRYAANLDNVNSRSDNHRRAFLSRTGYRRGAQLWNSWITETTFTKFQRDPIKHRQSSPVRGSTRLAGVEFCEER